MSPWPKSVHSLIQPPNGAEAPGVRPFAVGRPVSRATALRVESTRYWYNPVALREGSELCHMGAWEAIASDY